MGMKRNTAALPRLGLALFLVCAQQVQAETEEAKESLDRYMIVVTGTELLRGVYADSHTHFLSRTLGGLGVRCVGSVTVGDRAEELLGALKYSAERADLTIVTGGLGPTDDDITRGVLSKYSGIPLRESPEVLASLERRYASRRELPQNLRRQAFTPSSGTYLPNPNGTAVGLVFEGDRKVIVALPGPPRELRPMVANELLPYLGRRFGLRTTQSSVTLRFVGIGESSIQQVIDNKLEVPDDVQISSTFQAGRVDITLSLDGNSAAVLGRLNRLKKDLRSQLREYIYSEDGSSLQQRIVSLLAARGENLVLVEVGTGGAIADQLSTVEGSEAVFWGGYVASSHQRMLHLLGVENTPVSGEAEKASLEALGRSLAQDASEVTGCKWALVVTRGKPVSSGSFPLWITAGSRSTGYASKQTVLTGKGRSKRNRIVTQALDLLRGRLRQ